MYKIIFNLTKFFVNILHARGFVLTDIYRGKPSDIIQLREDLIQKQTEISMKRAEIVMLQNKIISTIEVPLFGLLAKSKDPMEKTTVTQIWFDNLRNLGKMIDEHEVLVAEFTDRYNTSVQKNNI